MILVPLYRGHVSVPIVGSVVKAVIVHGPRTPSCLKKRVVKDLLLGSIDLEFILHAGADKRSDKKSALRDSMSVAPIVRRGARAWYSTVDD